MMLLLRIAHAASAVYRLCYALLLLYVLYQYAREQLRQPSPPRYLPRPP